MYLSCMWRRRAQWMVLAGVMGYWGVCLGWATLDARTLSFVLQLSQQTGELAAAPADAELSVDGTSAKSGYTLSFPSERLILISDDDGVFRSQLNDSSEVELAVGSYDYELLYQGTIIQDSLIVTADTPVSVVIGFNTTVSANAARRLGTVRVRKKSVSEGRTLDADEVRKLPGTGGDVLGVLSSLPGVTSASGLFDTDLFIRGGSSSDISYRYSDIIVGSPYHQVFFFSIFPYQLINRLLFYPGGFSAAYENSQGSVVDIIPNELGDYEDKYDIVFNLSSGYADLAATIGFLDKFRISFGGRRTYYEAFLALIEALDTSNELGLNSLELVPVAYDAHTIFDWQVTDSSLFRFIFLFSGDDLIFNLDNFEYQSSEDDETIYIDSSYSLSHNWDSEAIQYMAQADRYEYDVGFYRYAERDSEISQEVEIYDISNEEYAFRGGFNYFFNDVLNLDSFLKYSIDRGYGLKKTHPDGKPVPDSSDYLTFASGPPDSAGLDAFLNAIKAYNNELVDTSENVLRHRLTLSSSLISDWEYITLNSGTVLYYDNLNTRTLTGDFRLRLTGFPAVNNGILEIFTYAGRFSQLPNIVTVDSMAGKIYFQDYKLNIPHTYQFGVGTVWNAFGFEFSLEPYYKLIRNRLIINPTFDSAFPEADGNYPTVNTDRGHAYGIETLIRRVGKGWFSGWFNYTWSRAYVESFSIPASVDEAFLATDEGNNGSDYLNYELKLVPFNENVEHSIKIVASFKITKNFSLGTRFITGSGKPYTPQVIGTNSSFTETDGVDCTFPFCDTGYTFVDDPEQINAVNLPWTFTWDLRFDWVLARKKRVTISLFIDVFNLEALFFDNVSGYNYERQLIRYDPSLNVGDPAPSYAITESTSNIIFPVFGTEFKF